MAEGDLATVEGGSLVFALAIAHRFRELGGQVVYGAPVDGRTNDDVLAAITAEIEKLIADGVSDEEMRLAKKSLISGAFFAQDSQTSLARIFGSELVIDTTIEDVQNWPSRVEAVTKDQVIAVAKKYLLSKQTVTGYLLPEIQEEKS